MPFDAHALDTLDYPRVRRALMDRASTPMGSELAHKLCPVADAGRIGRELDELEDALFGVSLSLGGIGDVRELRERAGGGRVLLGSELLEVAYALDGAMTVRRSITSNSRGPLLRLAAKLGEHSLLVRRILESLDRDGQVRDDASHQLREIRRKVEPLRQRIRDRLTSSLEKWADVLQDNLITIRRDRYVLPVQASRVSQVQGIIVDASSTGQTYFVEPATVTPLNNELTRLILDEEAEVRRILTELSSLVASDSEIGLTIETIGELDLIAAKAALTRDWKLNRPETDPGATYLLSGARHPLIENPVPNDISLGGGGTNLLLITGPNMGGKTATLKTLGLAALMHQSGLYVAADRARLPIIEDVLVDVGDEQSLEASLSTFAAHLQHLRYVLRYASPRTLILIDELGSGTDPAEGAALAQAMLEQLLTQDTRGIITSHLSPLKLFALETPGLKNASMGFDLEALAPTFQLQVGQPGRSYALAIARRMGIPEGVMTRAETILGPEGSLLERLLENLEAERRQLTQELENAKTARREAVIERDRVQSQRQEFEERKGELLAESSQKAEAAYAQALEQVRGLRARAREESARPRVLQELRDLRRSAQQERPQPAALPELRGDLLKVGSTVNVPAYGAAGQVMELRGDDLVVQLGVMKVSVRRRDVRLKAEESVKAAVRRSFNGVAPSGFQTELQLRGQHVEEALEELRSTIGEAAALRESPLRVVHGKGQGVLRRLIRDFLKADKRVDSFHDAEPNQGGHGVTIVNLKV
ncbi:endonuclease MutS2 [Deinococcus sp.]|uniref:endonuclease MutS2 n=1 Tax=Deinococcus sp. TaxID=47478 RepID=UPI0025F65914|nr:endonuclease MutS2 [Deinococcus sp.]